MSRLRTLSSRGRDRSRWLSAWGVVAVISLAVSILLVMFGLVEPFSPPQLVLAVPILVQEVAVPQIVDQPHWEPHRRAVVLPRNV